MSAKIKWLCRRGMKELDLLVDDYYQHDYPQATASEQAAFERLLEYQDPLIVDLLFDRCQDDDPEIQALIDVLKVKNSNGL
ncbi:succinate dehydrogenase assembly factor 2 [Suttonella sp. R2A3]|uniref:FAD assembly factor SdhE n=1 Tax=Suttonella sp. R2A3 TaxID=2908648 RepID=UPI001F19B1F7|nr:succinate dehydrogenase assembly factor 2 [Suttonella sp. R2A3]UJF23906.1 succinate dehydrogenase assembly factor 2 [Suttonella sp. R2A3]